MPDEKKSWIEPVLERELGRVSAPAGLWDQIERPRFPQERGATGRLVWALGAAMIVAGLLWGFHLKGEGPPAQTWMPARVDAKNCSLCHVGA